jgi:hypothetical protein
MVPLDSPRWKELRHAYGSAANIPGVIRAIQAGQAPLKSASLAEMRSAPTPWETAFTALYHQGTIYSATYAALPHLVTIADALPPEKRMETLLWVGAVVGSVGPHGPIPEDLLSDFENAIERVRGWSLEVARAAGSDSEQELPSVVAAFGLLRYRDSRVAEAIEELYDVEVIFECFRCEAEVIVHLEEPGPKAFLMDNHGRTTKENHPDLPADRSDYPVRLKKGKAILSSSPDPQWSPEETVNVLAALAEELGDEDLSRRILDLSQRVQCPECGESWRMLASFE